MDSISRECPPARLSAGRRRASPSVAGRRFAPACFENLNTKTQVPVLPLDADFHPLRVHYALNSASSVASSIGHCVQRPVDTCRRARVNKRTKSKYARARTYWHGQFFVWRDAERFRARHGSLNRSGMCARALHARCAGERRATRPARSSFTRPADCRAEQSAVRRHRSTLRRHDEGTAGRRPGSGASIRASSGVAESGAPLE